MKDDDADKRTPQETIADLQREIATLSQQVKRLIMAETKLYEYQEELDLQLKEYKELYELNRKLTVTLDLGTIFESSVAHIIQNLDFERAVFFDLCDSGEYRVCALDGYYDAGDKSRVAALAIAADAPVLRELAQGDGVLLYAEGKGAGEAAALRPKLLMDEFFICGIGSGPPPAALLAVGNSAENAEYYRKVSDSGSMLGLGNLVGLISTSVDNSIHYRKMEQALAQERVAEAKYRSIFDNALEGIFQRTAGGEYLEANPALARMLGYDSPQELMAHPDAVGRNLYVRPEKYDVITALLRERGAVEGFEAEMYRRDKSVIWASICARSVRDEKGALLFYEGTIMEVTQRKRAQEALAESERKYRQLSEALEQRVQEAVQELRRKDEMLIVQGRQAVMGEMLSNIAHQWRQPLNLLALLVQDLKMTKNLGDFTEEYLDENVEKTLEVIDRMSKTIDDFRYFFKPDKERVAFEVADVVEKALSLLNGSFKAHLIEPRVMLDGSPTVTGYPGEFTQVMLNILVNARDALIGRQVADPRIVIRVFAQGEKTVVTITDNAGGIPQEVLYKIFDPYFTTKGPEQGTGIGLFMCKNIIEKSMGGTLTARNVEGGAEFRIEV